MVIAYDHPLYYKYYTMKNRDHVPEWDDPEAFLSWALASGYEPGASLMRDRRRDPYGPDNCYWVKKTTPQASGQDQETVELIQRWNKTVNVFRKAAGLPLFKEDYYDMPEVQQ